ncbi:MAG TPA: GGDEF domain-containing protein [Polyangiaceae bacterium]
MPTDDDFDESRETTVVFDRRDLLDGLSPTGGRSHVLVRMDGSDVGQVTTLSGTDIECGRLAACEMHLPFEGVSRKHARITRKGGSYFVEDLSSANGTFVQGIRIAARTKLEDGNVIQLGPRVVFRYSVTDTGEEKILRQLYESSVKDSLTGAYNREYFGERLKSEVAYSIRHQTELSLVLLDVDHFKKVNDTYGHPAGDALLIATVAALSRTLRTEDVVARYGGEEFAVILRGIALAPAITVAERLRGLVETARVPNGEESIRCTISAGCASLACCDAPNGEALIAIADRRLYVAKRTGRNRVVAAG